MVVMSLEVVYLTGIWMSDSGISSRGSTGNLLISMGRSGEFLLI